MKSIITLYILILSIFWATAQNKTFDFEKELKPLNDKVKSLQIENNTLKIKVNLLLNEVTINKLSLDSLRIQTEENSKNLGLKISSTEKNTNQKISAVDESLIKNSLYGIIGVLAAVLLSGLLYWLLSNRQKSDKTAVEGQLSQTKKIIEEEQIQINTKLAELYNRTNGTIKS
jgi:hypothetical protein